MKAMQGELGVGNLCSHKKFRRFETRYFAFSYQETIKFNTSGGRECLLRLSSNFSLMTCVSCWPLYAVCTGQCLDMTLSDSRRQKPTTAYDSQSFQPSKHSQDGFLQIQVLKFSYQFFVHTSLSSSGELYVHNLLACTRLCTSLSLQGRTKYFPNTLYPNLTCAGFLSQFYMRIYLL